ncbi:diacylglycerol kinase [Brevibacillus massiliensis]|uniref:diacylglycerol kinase n=1 Tax=Brevibacillus massiliensis TaxID=1118054 RepID=UPI0002EA3F40|nr:diacylglycerol kinase family protein [Brevibacillus massiliensis]
MKELRRFWRSACWACAGIVFALKTQRNMQIHATAAVLVLLSAWWLHIPRGDVLLVFFSIGLVLSLELVNTAIESAVDLVTEEWHAKAKAAKDTAAGAVLLAAVVAIVIACCVFGPPLWDKITTILMG